MARTAQINLTKDMKALGEGVALPGRLLNGATGIVDRTGRGLVQTISGTGKTLSWFGDSIASYWRGIWTKSDTLSDKWYNHKDKDHWFHKFWKTPLNAILFAPRLAYAGVKAPFVTVNDVALEPASTILGGAAAGTGVMAAGLAAPGNATETTKWEDFQLYDPDETRGKVVEKTVIAGMTEDEKKKMSSILEKNKELESAVASLEADFKEYRKAHPLPHSTPKEAPKKAKEPSEVAPSTPAETPKRGGE